MGKLCELLCTSLTHSHYTARPGQPSLHLIKWTIYDHDRVRTESPCDGEPLAGRMILNARFVCTGISTVFCALSLSMLPCVVSTYFVSIFVPCPTMVSRPRASHLDSCLVSNT